MASRLDVSSPVRLESANAVSVTNHGPFSTAFTALPGPGAGNVVVVAWMCVIHPRSPGAGSGVEALLLVDEMTLITPRAICPLPVNSSTVSSLFTDSESRPSGVIGQAQHDLNSWLSSNT